MVAVHLAVECPNTIGRERASILLRDEARLINDFVGSAVASWDGHGFHSDGNMLGVPLRAEDATIEPDEDVVRLDVRYGLVRGIKALLHRSEYRAILREGLCRRFARRVTEKAHKVFCIGFQRTGTTTVLEALRVLGYFGVHFAPWLLPAVESGIFDWSQIDPYDAMADNPFPLMYRELDEHYPDSRFVLTVRDTDAWLRSERYLVEELAPHSKWTQHIYGTEHFEPERFRDRYERHNQEVLDYFAQRPDDLLVIDVTTGEPWAALCAFLDEPVPEEPFPRAGISRPTGA